jgi:GntR family transcriptional regulator
VLPFSIELKPGFPISDQVVFAVKKAVIKGQMLPGASFPSVRVLSEELRINRNTAHKVIADLVQEGVLITTPAVGSIIAKRESGSRRDKVELLSSDLERIAVDAKKLGLSLDEVQQGFAEQWKRLSEKRIP